MRQVLFIAFDYHMRADLVNDAIETMACEVPGRVKRRKQYGAVRTRSLLLQKKANVALDEPGQHAHKQWLSLAPL